MTASPCVRAAVCRSAWRARRGQSRQIAMLYHSIRAWPPAHAEYQAAIAGLPGRQTPRDKYTLVRYRGRRAKRPQLEAALAACKKHKAKLVVAKRLAQHALLADTDPGRRRCAVLRSARRHRRTGGVMSLQHRDPAGEGTGLGLSITHDIIVKQHSGSIEVDSQPGEFTEVRIICREPRRLSLTPEDGRNPTAVLPRLGAGR